MLPNTNDVVEITPGSKVEFDLYLVDEEGFAFSLASFVSGALTFKNCNGIETPIDLTLPGSANGKLHVVLSSGDTEDADKKWTSADLSLVDGSDETTIIPLLNRFKIVETAI